MLVLFIALFKLISLKEVVTIALSTGGRFPMYWLRLGNLVVWNQFVCTEEHLKDLKFLL